MGARQSKRSVDITTTPKKESISTEKVKDAAPQVSLEKIGEENLAPPSNGSILQDDSSKEKDIQKPSQEADKSTSEEVKAESSAVTTPSDETTPISPSETAPAATSPDEKGKRKDKKKKWSFRSISFTRRDKSKPVREATPKNGDVAKETLAEGGEESQPAAATAEPSKEESATPAQSIEPSKPDDSTSSTPADSTSSTPADPIKPPPEQEEVSSTPVLEKSIPEPETEEKPASLVDPEPTETKAEETKEPETTETTMAQERVEESKLETESETVEKPVEIPVEKPVEKPVEDQTMVVGNEDVEAIPLTHGVEEEEKNEAPPPPETSAPSRVANFATTEMLAETAPMEIPLENGISHPPEDQTAAQEDKKATPEETDNEPLPPAITEDVTSVTQAIDQIEITDKAVAAAVDDEEIGKTCPSNELIVDSMHQ